METQNPFNNMEVTVPQQNQGALVDIASQREVAEVQAAIILAKKFPRNQIEAMDRILIACQRPTLAESALYSYARGGTDIGGPSIRLGEAIAQNWGNIQFGIRELDQRNGESTVESYAWDLETNTRQSKVFQVKHERHTKAKGTVRLTDPRDIYELVANQGARRLRACILGIIPGDVVDAAKSQCEETLRSRADTSPDAVKKMLEAFSSFGVSREQIEKRIQRKLDSITPAQVISLRKIYNSLKDEMSSPGDWFEVVEKVEQKKGTEGLKEKLKGKKEKPKDETTEEDPRPFITCPDSGEKTYLEWCENECPNLCDAYSEVQK